jgi:hypothetical protein
MQKRKDEKMEKEKEMKKNVYLYRMSQEEM